MNLLSHHSHIGVAVVALFCLDAPKKRNWQREAALMEVFSRGGKTDHDAARAKELPANLRKNALPSVARD